MYVFAKSLLGAGLTQIANLCVVLSRVNIEEDENSTLLPSEQNNTLIFHLICLDLLWSVWHIVVNL